MKIHAFKVEQLGQESLEQVVSRIAATPLDDRLRGPATVIGGSKGNGF